MVERFHLALSANHVREDQSSRTHKNPVDHMHAQHKNKSSISGISDIPLMCSSWPEDQLNRMLGKTWGRREVLLPVLSRVLPGERSSSEGDPLPCPMSVSSSVSSSCFVLLYRPPVFSSCDSLRSKGSSQHSPPVRKLQRWMLRKSMLWGTCPSPVAYIHPLPLVGCSP